MSYTALYRKFRPAVFEDVKGQEQSASDMRICCAEPGVQEKQPLRRSLQERSTASTRWMEVPVGNALPVKPLRQALP